MTDTSKDPAAVRGDGASRGQYADNSTHPHNALNGPENQAADGLLPERNTEAEKPQNGSSSTVNGGAADEEPDLPAFLDKRANRNTEQSDPSPVMVDNALRYVERGWPVFPVHGIQDGKCSCGNANCPSPAKHPRTPNGVKDATIDPLQIESWWTQWPDANIGIACGSASGIDVLDVDLPEGEVSLAALEQEHGPLPSTRTVSSGSGGMHLYFQHTGGKISWNGMAPAGIDLKGEGGYVIAPPSKHISGGTYSLDAELGEADIAAMPDWLKEMVCKPSMDPAPAHNQPPASTIPIDTLSISDEHKSTIREGVPEGQRSERLFGVMRAMVIAGHDDETIRGVLLDSTNGLSEKPLQKGPVWLEAEIRRARDKPDRPVEVAVPSTNCGGLNIQRLSDVQPEDVEWLWYPYIPNRKLTSIDGDPGVGKSFLIAAMASMLSRGDQPPAGKTSGKPVRVLIMSAEDGLADTLRPRLDKLGADVELVFGSDTGITLDEEGLSELARHIREHRPGLVVIDPLVAFMDGKLDPNKANQARAFMRPLAEIAFQERVAIVTIRHLNKGERAKALYRSQGSIDFTAACRSVLMVGLNPNDEAHAVVAHAKHNLSRKGLSISYTIDAEDGMFRWGGTVDISAEDLCREPQDSEGHSALNEAVEFLKALLADGPVAANQCISEGKEAGITKRTLDRAKAKLGARSLRTDTCWAWELKQGSQDA